MTYQPGVYHQLTSISREALREKGVLVTLVKLKHKNHSFTPVASVGQSGLTLVPSQGPLAPVLNGNIHTTQPPQPSPSLPHTPTRALHSSAPTVPCPPGYMHLKIRPNSSACTLPAGVSSPPHLRISTSEGSRDPILNYASLHYIMTGLTIRCVVVLVLVSPHSASLTFLTAGASLPPPWLILELHFSVDS
ncbi:hypothetical protein E2C01_029628 [Portunus trituberculatus]|uniref:Uncharacterized protein n=1 Tax=Portunus trituberculatus TaxID=210409 RepID=A0A5B7ENG1_PORTR|nr:hypothetical protein [Portunus trituberculatus]